MWCHTCAQCCQYQQISLWGLSVYCHKPVASHSAVHQGGGIWGGVTGEETDRHCHPAANECKKTDILAPGRLQLHPTTGDITTPLVMSPGVLSFTLPALLSQVEPWCFGLMQEHVFFGNLRNFPCSHAQMLRSQLKHLRGPP